MAYLKVRFREEEWKFLFQDKTEKENQYSYLLNVVEGDES